MERMRATRTRLGLTLEDLERSTRIDISTLSRYENGHRVPTLGRAQMVARALGVSLDFLVGDQHEKQADTAGKSRGELAKTKNSPATTAARR